MPPDLRQGTRRSFDQGVGGSVEDLRKRLGRMDRKLLQGGIADIPRAEPQNLRERMGRLDDPPTRSYPMAMKLTGDRGGRKAVRSSTRRRADKVEGLLKALERLTR